MLPTDKILPTLSLKKEKTQSPTALKVILFVLFFFNCVYVRVSVWNVHVNALGG